MNIQNTLTIETARLRLRKFQESDLPAFYRIYSDEILNTYLPCFPLKNETEAFTFFEERYASVYQQECGYHYAICFKEQDVPIGYIKIDMDDAHDLGYGLLPEYQHLGIMTEAGIALLKQVKEDGLSFVTATHDRNNAASGKVMKRLGMTYCYSYEERWLPKNYLVTFRMYQINFDDQQSRIYKKYWDQYPIHCIETKL